MNTLKRFNKKFFKGKLKRFNKKFFKDKLKTSIIIHTGDNYDCETSILGVIPYKYIDYIEFFYFNRSDKMKITKISKTIFEEFMGTDPCDSLLSFAKFKIGTSEHIRLEIIEKSEMNHKIFMDEIRRSLI